MIVFIEHFNKEMQKSQKKTRLKSLINHMERTPHSLRNFSQMWPTILRNSEGKLLSVKYFKPRLARD